MKQSHKRIIAKSLSWRFLAVTITTGIVYTMTGEVGEALQIGFIDFAVKMFVYFSHEKTWEKVKWGLK